MSFEIDNKTKYTMTVTLLKQLFLPFLSYKFLLWQLILREIRSRYKQSILGYAWVILNPLVQLLVYSFVFSIIFRFPTGSIPYSIFLFIGLLPWIYLQTSISTATLSLVDSSDLLKKVYFPREVLIYSIITSKSIDFLFASLVLIAFLIYYQISPAYTVIFILPIFMIQILLMTGISLLLSTFNLFYRDIQYLVNLLLMLWMYLSPVVYSLSLVPKKWVFLYKLNPMVGIIEGYRSAIFNHPFDYGALGWSIIISFLVFSGGFLIFKKSERVFADLV